MQSLFALFFVVGWLLAGATPLNAVIKILDTKTITNLDIHELSALAYREGRLYALSDKGILHHLSLDLSHNKIEQLKLLHSYKLRNKKGKRLKKKKRDAEGMALYKKGLLISFEGASRVAYFSLDGILQKKMPLHPDLQNKDAYRGSNKGLEALAYSKKYGILTAPEMPLITSSFGGHTIYALTRRWRFNAEGSLTELYSVDASHVIVLLREFSFFSQRRVTTLLQLDLDSCAEEHICQPKLIAKLDSDKEVELDNYEGLCGVGSGRYLMVSDDNDSIFQKTLLVLFEIVL